LLTPRNVRCIFILGRMEYIVMKCDQYMYTLYCRHFTKFYISCISKKIFLPHTCILVYGLVNTTKKCNHRRFVSTVKTIFTAGFSPYYDQPVFRPTVKLITSSSVQTGGEITDGEDSLCGSETKSSAYKSLMACYHACSYDVHAHLCSY